MAGFKSTNSATNTLKGFFQDSPNSNSVTYDEIIRVAGRAGKPEPINRQWLSNKLSLLRYYNLIDTDYETDGNRRKVSGVTLTDEGRKALGRAYGGDGVGQSVVHEANVYIGGREITLESVVRDINYLKRQNPSVDFTFTMKPKEDSKKIHVR